MDSTERLGEKARHTNVPGVPDATPIALMQSVIDALSAHIAVLDPEADIVAVNAAWSAFADANGGSLPDHGIGLNYLDLCRGPARAAGPVDEQASLYGRTAADGIERVMRGEVPRFQLTYPCHSADEQRWFLLTVTPLQCGLGRCMVVAHENVTTLMQREEAVAAALIGTVEAIADIAEARDPYVAGHQKSVSRLAETIAGAMGLDAERRTTVKLGGLIHDVGKIRVPSELLARPGRLSALELQLIRTHAESGHAMVADIPFPWPIADVILQHHERLDGSGYPRGIRGDGIILEARIVAVADVLDAIVSHRPYRPGRGLPAAMRELRGGAGRIYDAQVVAALDAAPVQRLLDRTYAPRGE